MRAKVKHAGATSRSASSSAVGSETISKPAAALGDEAIPTMRFGVEFNEPQIETSVDAGDVLNSELCGQDAEMGEGQLSRTPSKLGAIVAETARRKSTVSDANSDAPFAIRLKG